MNLSFPKLRLPLCVCAGVALLLFPAQAAQGAAEGVALCLNTAVPSLFPFLVLANYVAVSGMDARAGRLFAPLCRLFGLPDAAGPTVLLGLLGGYPVGAAGTARLLHAGQISRAQAHTLLKLCCVPSPAFLIAAVGGSLLGAPAAGAVLWLCTVLAAALSAFFGRGHTTAAAVPPAPPRADAFVAAVQSAARAVLSLCAMIVVFSTVRSLLAAVCLADAFAHLAALLLPAGAAESLLTVLLEVTAGASACAQNGAPLWLFAFGAGWGGLCVHGQVFSFFAAGEVQRSRFFAARLTQGLLAALLSAAAFGLFPALRPQRTAAAFANALVSEARVLSGTAPASLALLALCLLFCLVGAAGGAFFSQRRCKSGRRMLQ